MDIMVDRCYVVESDLVRIRNRWCRFRYFLPLLSRTVLPLGEYDRIYTACTQSLC